MKRKCFSEQRSLCKKPISNQNHSIHREHRDICDQHLGVVYEHDNIYYKRESDHIRKSTATRLKASSEGTSTKNAKLLEKVT
ncbi:hypothetical protein [Fischerella thermalis]|uniref:hypothetical protein n=1 Tax=Fischerella thermalis TaxID=372787 RepID=UPI0015E1511D|nr:hypothetical protein [Fischerella thermalis]